MFRPLKSLSEGGGGGRPGRFLEATLGNPYSNLALEEGPLKEIEDPQPQNPDQPVVCDDWQAPAHEYDIKRREAGKEMYLRSKNISVSNCEAGRRAGVCFQASQPLVNEGDMVGIKIEGVADLSMASWLFESPISASGSRRKSRRQSLSWPRETLIRRLDPLRPFRARLCLAPSLLFRRLRRRSRRRPLSGPRSLWSGFWLSPGPPLDRRWEGRTPPARRRAS